MRTSFNRGIISDHFQGVGTVTREMVRERAREIAMINGHSANHCTRQDLLDAQRELTGAIPGLDDEDDTLINAASWAKNQRPPAMLWTGLRLRTNKRLAKNWSNRASTKRSMTRWWRRRRAGKFFSAS